MDNTTVTQKRAAIYARVSTEHEAQILALGNQLEWYDEWLKFHPEYKEVKRYVDEGITGTSAKKRKGFTQMITDAENGNFDIILTREVSRFARNTEEVLKFVRKLKKRNVSVYFKRLEGYMNMRADGEISKEKFSEIQKKLECEITTLTIQVIELTPIECDDEPEEDISEKLKMIEYALEQYTLFDDNGDIPDGVIEAFVEKIVVSDKGFDWYLYINPDIPYSYNVKGKRSGTAEVVSASLCLGQGENTHICHIQDRLQLLTPETNFKYIKNSVGNPTLFFAIY